MKEVDLLTSTTLGSMTLTHVAFAGLANLLSFTKPFT